MIPNEKKEWLGLKLADHRVNFIAIEQYVSGLSACISVALWLCMFGCLLQGPIRLKVL